MKTHVEQLSVFLTDVIDYLPPGLFMCIAIAYIQNGHYFKDFRHEFVGSLLMIVATFSAGKWIGTESLRMAWTSHGLGVIAADYFGQGPHVNPAVTGAMWSLGKCSYTEALVRVAGQLAGGLVAFPLFHAISNAYDLEPFGGPEFNIDEGEHAVEAFCSEYLATALLLVAIFLLNWEWNFGNYHYIIKQSLTAVVIRALIEGFPIAGPAMNPMLASTWDAFGVGADFAFSSEFQHYFVYWFAPFAGALTASFLYAIYAGEPFFGMALPIGPIKKKKIVAGKLKKK